MAKVRVHELAKELGKTSKELIEALIESGEFVRSASSTLEPPVVRKMKEKFAAQASTDGNSGTSSANKSSKSGKKDKSTQSASKETGKDTTKKASEEISKEKAAKPASPKPGQRKPAASPSTTAGKKSEDSKTSSNSGKPEAKNNTSTANSSTKKPGPRPGVPSPAAFAKAESQRGESQSRGRGGQGRSKDYSGEQSGSRRGNNPFASSQGMPKPGGRDGNRDSQRGDSRGSRDGTRDNSRENSRSERTGGPRPGNNPFASSQGMPRPGGRDGNREDSRGSGRDSSRSGSGRGNRPTPSAMPSRSALGADMPDANTGRGGSRGNSRRGTGNNRSNNASAAQPGTGNQMRGRGGRGATQGAFGSATGPGKNKARKSKRAKKAEFEQQAERVIGGVVVPRGDGSTVVRIRSGASMADFAEKIGANPAGLVTVIFQLGEMATATQSLDADTIGLLGAELGYNVEIFSKEDEDKEILSEFDIDLEMEELEEDDTNLQPRPPVVTVMGHVDHGKTKLLDAIRSTDVVAGEAGGITQSIGAYQVRVTVDGERRAVTFVDTPGHEAFTAMRARGAEVTDIAILVVAADDGVMPQTVEAINHAQAASVPIVVAVNKIDKDGANPEKVKAQLTEYGLVAEEYGGDVMFANISAKQRIGIDKLLEAVILTADATLDLRANPDKPARGVVIEGRLDRGRGAVSTTLVQSGTLRVGDALVAGQAYGRVRALFDEHGQNVDEAPPSRPVAVIGLSEVPTAGDSFIIAPDDRTARQIAEKRQAAARAAQLARSRKAVFGLEALNQAIQEGQVETLNLIIKGDSSGAVEALEDSLLKIDVGEEVGLRVIHRGVGAITQNDVNLALAGEAVIIGFNVRPAERVGDMAAREGVDIHYYSVIYDAIEEVESALRGKLKPIFEEVELGKAEILQIFRSSKFGNIAGCIIRKGVVKRGTKARLVRNGVVIEPNLQIHSLRREKDDVTEVREGYECGIGLQFKDIQEGDVIETFEMQEKARD